MKPVMNDNSYYQNSVGHYPTQMAMKYLGIGKMEILLGTEYSSVCSVCVEGTMTRSMDLYLFGGKG